MWGGREGKKERWYQNFSVQLHNLQLLPTPNLFIGGWRIEEFILHHIMLICNTPVFHNSIPPLHLPIQESLSQGKYLTFPPIPLCNTKDRDDNNAFNFLAITLDSLNTSPIFFTFFIQQMARFFIFVVLNWGGFHFCFVFTNLHLIYFRSLLFCL